MSDTFGNRIQAIREKAGLSKYAFAKKLGMSPSSINNYETGKTLPGELVMRKICRIFEVELEWLKNGGPKEETPAAEIPAATKEPPVVSTDKVTVAEAGESKRKEVPESLQGEKGESYRKESPEAMQDEKTEEKEPERETEQKEPENAAPVTLSVMIQSQSGAEIDVLEIQRKVKASCPDAQKVYVKPEENRAYWVSENASGAVVLWEA